MIFDKFKLSGKVAIVTGASRGLGQAMAIGLAEAGSDVAGVSRTSMEETRKQIEHLGRIFLPIKADLLSIKPVPSIIEKVLEQFGHLDILVNNAGIIKRAPTINFCEKDWDDVLNINLKSLFFLSQAAAKQFIKQKNGGKIINIASMLSFQGGIMVSSYTASKSGVMGITRLMANEWARYNINVNAIAPGYMATENTAPLRADKKRNAEILSRIPKGKWGSPEDLKGTVVFLSSEASDYLTGYTIAVDGGWLAR